ncbi:MAG: YggT family protein [Clostridia bacterium]|nr:YggT family protein [Clostridia bacterium]
MSSTVRMLIGEGIYYFLMLLDYAILIRVILSWFMDPFSKVMQVFILITEPVIAPIRNLMSRIMGNSMMRLDFSPFIAMFLLTLIRNVVMRMFF